MRVPVSLVLPLGLAACTVTTNEQIIGADTGGTAAADTAATQDTTPGPGADSGDGTDGTDATDGTDGGDVADGTDGGDPWGFIPEGENAVCSVPFKVTGGSETGFPFTGHSYNAPNNESYSWSCTRCPNGYDFIKGKYRRYTDDNPELPDPAEARETWEFNGNAFVNVLEEVDSADGQKKTVIAKGYYFCPDAGTIDFANPDYWNVMLVYTEVDPPGGFGIDVGATDPCFLGYSIDNGGDDFLVGCNFLWDPKETMAQQDTYCRVGATIQGRECKDPFAQ